MLNGGSFGLWRVARSTPWARLGGSLSHRSTGPAGSSNQLREQRLAGETGTRWTPGEVLVSDIIAWRLVMLSVYPDDEMTVLAEHPQFDLASAPPPAAEYPQLSFAVAPAAGSSQPEMTVVRLLVPRSDCQALSCTTARRFEKMRCLRGRGYFVMTQVLICLCLTALASRPPAMGAREWALMSQEVEMSSKS